MLIKAILLGLVGIVGTSIDIAIGQEAADL